MAVEQQSFLDVLCRAASNKKQLSDRALLITAGKFLNEELFPGFTVRDFLMVSLLKIRDKSGLERRFIVNDAQRRIAARWGRRNIILKARQLGMTTYVAARFFIDTITHPGTLTVQVAHDQRSAEDIFRIVHRFQENLPEFLRKGALRTSRANSRQLAWLHLDSGYRVETAGDPNAGRGTTIRNLHCSEVAMWPRDGVEALASLRAAVPPQGQIVLESTPQGAGGAFYDEWQRAEETGYVRHFLPWWLDKSYRVERVAAGELSEEERELVEKHGLDDEQIVFRRDLKANYGRKMAQEYAESAEECFLASGECVFEIEMVEARLKLVEEDPEAFKLPDNMPKKMKGLTRFLPAMEKKKYFIGVDPAGGGVDGDYACAEVINEKGVQCAELHGHMRPEELAMRVAELGHEYNDALVVVERNNHGHAVLTDLKHLNYPKVYHQNGVEGFLITAPSRARVVEWLRALVQEKIDLFSSPTLLREFRTFVRQTDGVPRALSGAHDDTVMAMALAQWVREQG